MPEASPFGRLPLIADANLAARLLAGSGSGTPCAEALNAADPGAVAVLHAADAAAGARLLRTNTAAASAAHLAPHGLADRAEAINNSGSALARNALPGARSAAGVAVESDGATPPAGFVMGTLAAPPAADLVTEPPWQRAYGEQIVYLSDTGVDFLLLEHVARLADAVALTRQIKRITDAPVLAALRLDAAGHTAEGTAAAAAGAALVAAGADALGLSCADVGEGLEPAVDDLLAAGLPLAVLAGNAAGLAPDAWAARIAALAGRGVAILGGCCGVETAHIRALAALFPEPAPPG